MLRQEHPVAPEEQTSVSGARPVRHEGLGDFAAATHYLRFPIVIDSFEVLKRRAYSSAIQTVSGKQSTVQGAVHVNF